MTKTKQTREEQILSGDVVRSPNAPQDVLLDHYIVCTDGYPGYWGRGTTEAEAVQASKWIRVRDKVMVFRCDSNASMDELASLRYRAVQFVGRGVVQADNSVVIIERPSQE